MRSRELQKMLAHISGRTDADVDQRTRKLREAMKIPSGPRGVHAPHMDISDALLHVLAMVSRRPAEASDVVHRLFSARLVPHPFVPDLSEAFQGEARRLATFVLIGMNRGLRTVGVDIKSFEFHEDGSYAWMHFDRRSLKGLRFLFSVNRTDEEHSGQAAAELYDRVETRTFGNRFVIGGEHLRTIGEKVLIDCPIEAVEGEADAG